jgi:hypothetical protein
MSDRKEILEFWKENNYKLEEYHSLEEMHYFTWIREESLREDVIDYYRYKWTKNAKFIYLKLYPILLILSIFLTFYKFKKEQNEFIESYGIIGTVIIPLILSISLPLYVLIFLVIISIKSLAKLNKKLGQELLNP